MAIDRFLITPDGMNEGLQTNVRPWLIGDNAFSVMRNCNIYRGRVKKRFGTWLIGSGGDTSTAAAENARLRVFVGTTDGSGTLSGTVPGMIFEIGQMFSADVAVYTVVVLGTPGTMLATQGAGTFDTTNGAFVITGAPINTDVFWYPADPVMGITTYGNGVINDEPTFAFDTQFAYQRSSGAWARLTGGSDTWTGTNAQFFWATTWRGTDAADNNLFVTNFNSPDHIRYYNAISGVWTIFQPQFGPAGTDTINTARLIAVYKNRLLLFNTFEGPANGGLGTQYFNRLRYSQFGDPLQSDAFRDDIDGKGGFEDCPVKQQIVTCEFLKDVLIVYCESSTWQIVYTNNEVRPFIWQQINTELGAESTFSVVPFDKVMIGIGNVGVHACNGSNVERIDQKIPQAVFDIHNDNDGITRVQGIRDYFTELIYWTFPATEAVSAGADNIFPNRVLVYNYITGAWSFHDDSFTALGYFQQQNDLTWGSTFSQWDQTTLTWNAPQLQGNFRQVLAGNQEGFVFLVMPDITRNAPSLQITNIDDIGGGILFLTIINHNLANGSWIYVENTGDPALDNTIHKILVSTSDPNNEISIISDDYVGPYLGGGTVARVSQIDMWTKQYNFYAKDARNAYVSKIEFMVDKTNISDVTGIGGQITVDYYASASTDVSLLAGGQGTGALIGTGILDTSPYDLYPLEKNQNRLWHPVYTQVEGETCQFRIYFSDDQMILPDVSMNTDFQLHCFNIFAQPTSRLQ